jgi:hypothetical protein
MRIYTSSRAQAAPLACPAPRIAAATPVKRVIIVGERRSIDLLFAAPGLPYTRAPDTRIANTVSTVPGGRVE